MTEVTELVMTEVVEVDLRYVLIRVRYWLVFLIGLCCVCYDSIIYPIFCSFHQMPQINFYMLTHQSTHPNFSTDPWVSSSRQPPLPP